MSRTRDILVHSFWVITLPVLAAIMRIALVVRIRCINGDGIGFLEMARHFSDHGFASMVREYAQHPLYPMLIAWLHPLTGDWELSGRIISVLFGSLAVIPLYLFAFHVVRSKTVGVWAGFLYVLAPYFIRIQAQVFTEGLFHFFLYWSLYLGWLAIAKDHVLSTGLCGLASGLAYLVRPEGIGVILVVGGWIAVHVTVQALFFNRLSSGHPIRMAIRLGLLLMLLIAFLVPSLPYLVNLRDLNGQWMLTNKKNAARTLDVETHEAAMRIEDSELRKLAKYYYQKQPGNRGLTTAQNVVVSLLEVAREFMNSAFPPIFLLILVGLIYRPTLQRDTMGESYLGLIMGLYLAVYFMLAFKEGYLDKRHVLTLVGFSLFWGGVALEELVRWAGTRRLPMRFWKPNYGIESPPDYKIIIALVLVLITLPKSLRDPQQNSEIYRTAGEWVESRYPKDAILMTNMDEIGYYSRLEYKRLRPVRVENFAPQLQASKARLLAMDAHKDFDKFLQDERWTEFPSLRVVKRFQVDEGRHAVIIFEIAP